MKRSTASVLCLFITCVTVVGLACRDGKAAEKLVKPSKSQAGVVGADFIFEQASFPQCHASTVEESGGKLVVVWFGGTHEKHADVGIWVSRLVGSGWTDPVEVANGIQHSDKRYPCWNPVLFQQPGGALQLYFKVGPSPTTWWGELTESRDNGVTWSEPRRLPEDILGPVKNKPILLKSGALLCGSSTEHDGWQVQFEITSDAGKTWKLVGPINDASVFNVIQPTLLVHPAGAIQALCRSKESIIVETWSTDSGKTWSKLQPTSLPNPNSGIDGVTLKDGRQLLVYNHTTREKGKWGGPRSKLNVAVSKDGKNWLAAVELENEPGEFSYPAVIQSADGLVHITYTWKRKRVKRVVLDPKQLKLKEMVEGNWPK